MGNTFMRIAAVLLSGALMVGLAGCGGGSDPAPSTSPPTTPAPVPQTDQPTEPPSPDVAPTPETVRPDIDIPEPEMHPDMAKDDIDGADSAARYFLDLYGYAYETGNLKPWIKLSGPECGVCDIVSEQVEEFYGRGEWFENFALLHGKAGIYYPTDNNPAYLVLLEVQATAFEHYNAAGELIYTSPGKTYPEYAIFVQYVGPFEWIVTGVAPLGSQE